MPLLFASRQGLIFFSPFLEEFFPDVLGWSLQKGSLQRLSLKRVKPYSTRDLGNGPPFAEDQANQILVSVPLRDLLSEGNIVTQKTLSENLVVALGYLAEGESAGLAEARPLTPPLTITINREPWSAGSAVAREVGRRLGWPVYEHELLEMVARKMRTLPEMLELIDEKPMSWLEQCVINLTSPHKLDQDSYLVHLETTIRGLGRQGRCIIVGHGAGLLLPPAKTLRLRIVGDPPDRIAAIRKSKGLSEKKAARLAEKAIQEQHDFFKKYFSKEISDPHLYDLVLNASHLTLAECAETIIEALHCRETRTAGGYDPRSLAVTGAASLPQE